MVRKGLFGLILIMTVLTGCAFLTGQGLERTLFSAGYYRAILDEIDGEDLQDYFLAVEPPELNGRQLRIEATIFRTLVRITGEEWLREQAFYAVEEYLLFVTGEQEELVIKVDLLEHQSVFLEALKKELGGLCPDLLDEYGPLLLEEIITRFDLPTELTWIELDSKTDLDSGFKEDLDRINQARTSLRLLPWISLAVMLVTGFLWLKPGGTFIALGLGIFLSGVLYYFIWPAGWAAVVVPSVESMAAGQDFLELIWARESHIIYSITKSIINRLSLYFAAFGVAVLVFGLFVEGCSRLSRGPLSSRKRSS